MQEWHLVITNLLVGTGLILVGFRIHKPKFVSREAEEKFYNNFTLFFRAGGILMVVWGIINFYQIINN